MALLHQGQPLGIDGTLTVRPSATAAGLLLRPWTEQDIPAMIAAYRDPVMRRWLRTRSRRRRRIGSSRPAVRTAGPGPASASPYWKLSPKARPVTWSAASTSGAGQ
jgi:hypothetical protein